LAKNSCVTRRLAEHIHPLIATWDLGRGESEVLTLAMQRTTAVVVMDDLQARKCSKLFKIPLVGSLGLVVMAKRAGHIQAAKPEFEKLIKAGLRLDVAMLDRIYKKIGE